MSFFLGANSKTGLSQFFVRRHPLRFSETLVPCIRSHESAGLLVVCVVTDQMVGGRRSPGAKILGGEIVYLLRQTIAGDALWTGPERSDGPNFLEYGFRCGPDVEASFSPSVAAAAIRVYPDAAASLCLLSQYLLGFVLASTK